ncbi:hypothetical protein QFZ85_004608 [Pseudomonas frederiksbergensis]
MDALRPRLYVTQSVTGCIPTRSVGTINVVDANPVEARLAREEALLANIKPDDYPPQPGTR